jgi:hypothetical protein
MTDAAFILVIVALGGLYFVLFRGMKNRFSDRHPHRKNPIRFWLRGKSEDDEDR